MLRIFIGYDSRETVALHVLAHTIQKYASIPVSITPLDRKNMSRILWRARGDYDSTDFAISRFLVPYLCDYEGWGIFMDCDMLCRADVAELANYATLTDKYQLAVRVVKHDYQPKEATKFLGAAQTKYERKNWSSVILFNNTLCRALTPDYVNKAPGLELHRFQWLQDFQIGTLPKEWNYLVGEDNQCEPAKAKLIHYTKGGPYFTDYRYCEFATEWLMAQDEMNYAHDESI